MSLRIVSAVLAAGTLTGLAAAAHADVPLTFGARVGYSLPMGDVAKDSPLKDSVGGAIPLQLDAMYRINPNIHAGLYFSYGPAMTGEKNKDSAKDSSLSQVRYGLRGQYHLAPDAGMDPWVGLFVGSESARQSSSKGSDTMSSSMSALQFGLQGGAAWTVAPNVRVGPMLEFGAGKYTGGSFSGGTVSGVKIPSQDSDIPSDQQALHMWLTIGVGGTFSL